MAMAIYNDQDWNIQGQIKKNELRCCEVCGDGHPINELNARHLAYGFPLDEKDMIVLCDDCNYNFHLAEDRNKEQITKLNMRYMHLLVNLMENYCHERDEIMSDSIILATSDKATNRRPSIERLFTHPNYIGADKDMDEFMVKNAKFVGIWDGHNVTRMTASKLEILRKTKRKK